MLLTSLLILAFLHENESFRVRLSDTPAPIVQAPAMASIKIWLHWFHCPVANTLQHCGLIFSSFSRMIQHVCALICESWPCWNGHALSNRRPRLCLHHQTNPDIHCDSSVTPCLASYVTSLSVPSLAFVFRAFFSLQVTWLSLFDISLTASHLLENWNMGERKKTLWFSEEKMKLILWFKFWRSQSNMILHTGHGVTQKQNHFTITNRICWQKLCCMRKLN